MGKIIVIGGGGHAKVLISVIKKSLQFELAGYVDINDQGEILGVKYLGNDSKLDEIFSKGVMNAAIGIGQINVTQKRINVVENMKNIGFTFPPIISIDATVNEDVLIGEGTQILDGAVINSGTRIGRFSIINTKATVEHDCKVGSFCHIATGAVLSGGVEVDDFSMIGSNAVIVQYKKITSNCMIGAGAVVTKDITAEGVYVGNPARQTK
ncbi:MAG: acetyltransferase [Bacteroidetes bacterium]|nr:acetyltransferase [Bacteroidota bacterium]